MNLHLILHVLVPAVVAYLFFRHDFKRALLIMLVTMLVDLDHLLATPIYDPNRCSIGFHPLHRIEMIVVYALLLVLPKVRLVGIGLLIHMVLDAFDCLAIDQNWSFLPEVP